MAPPQQNNQVMLKQPIVLITEQLSAEGLAILRDGGAEVREAIGQSPAVLTSLVGEANALIVRSKTAVDATMLAAAPDLRVVARAGVGTDSIDVDAATRQGILVLNTPDASTIAVAEHTIALMLAQSRHLTVASGRIAAGEWSSRGLAGSELAGKTLGIIGLGRIGAAVAKRALALEMRLLACDAFVSEARAQAMGVTLVDFDELLARSDVITIHAPLTPQTRHLLGSREFAKMKAGASIINCSRGGLLDEDALLAALDSGHLASAALDVVENEPPAHSRTWNLLQHSGVVATPHMGAATREAQIRIATDLCRDVLAVLRGSPPAAAVNAPVAPAVIRPFVLLADVLGRAYPQLTRQSRVPSFSLTLEGELGAYDPTPCVAAFLAGLLAQVSDRRISTANALTAAHEMGVVVEALAAPCQRGFTGALTVRGGDLVLAGTIVHGDRPRLVEIDGFEIEIAPHGPLLLTRHDDVPGIIGKVGTMLGDSGINVATMTVARDDHGHALMMLAVDREPSEIDLQRLRTIAGMTSVSHLTL